MERKKDYTRLGMITANLNLSLTISTLRDKEHISNGIQMVHLLDMLYL